MSAMCLALLATSCKKTTPVNPPDKSEENLKTYQYLQKKSEKRGIGGQWAGSADMDVLTGATWCYNWGTLTSTKLINALVEHDIIQYNMAWNNNWNGGGMKNCKEISPKSDIILGFNEPMFKDQANMSPSAAAGYWADLKTFAKANGFKLVSPALNHGTNPGYGDARVWMDEFLAQPEVELSDMIGIACHSYMASASGFINDIAIYKKWGLPLWVTEFCQDNANGSVNSQMKQMAQSFNSMEQDDMVAKYAWFMMRNGNFSTLKSIGVLGTKEGDLTNLGIAFNNLSTMDKSVVYEMNKRIPAEHYRACSIDETTKESVSVEVSTDDDGILAINEFAKGRTVDYQVALISGESEVWVRYYALRASSIEIYALSEDSDDAAEELIGSVDLPKTGSKKWDTVKANINLKHQGNKIIRVKCSEGLPIINWFEFVTK